MGFYYSLYEWYNPLYRTDLEKYVDDHMIPQLKDLVTRYTPDIVWTDGEWDKTSREWKSEEFLAWLYNDSPVRENVVVNDRWGSETRSKHGGFYTSEYGLVGDTEGTEDKMEKPWEECRGIGTSFGYNRAENLDSYASGKDLVKLLVSTVAKGGNLLLDIGPAADGTIPVIMQQRLMEIGNWLKVNGEAIYGTRAFIRGKKDEKINPSVSKDLFFTRKGRDLYVICTSWPENNILLNDLRSRGDVKVSMLGTDKPVGMKSTGGNTVIIPPKLSPDDYQPAYVFKLTNILK
jgi:alpha-L-fucosidase